MVEKLARGRLSVAECAALGLELHEGRRRFVNLGHGEEAITLHRDGSHSRYVPGRR
ncbi:hypothetical protein GCM10011512_29270 [Tersicoccus solisilvae]|uniref:Uncharacterized protein n=1 Tax=Tersicoccus solisilvae TaxID=1882339 RepID=A0ABQ1PP61_9MICC|nr:hypothetical protein [Tersicoccus solisilvae]GGD00544.1 hypothetical protein GCM10011512_29270 [Tersicoccus solisilvae]